MYFSFSKQKNYSLHDLLHIMWIMCFYSVKFGRKMMYVNYLEELAQYINLDQLIIPPQVIEYAI